MIIKTLINEETGEIEQVLVPGNPENYPNGGYFNTKLIKDFTLPIALADISQLYYYKSGEFRQRNYKPTANHSWNNVSETWEIATENVAFIKKSVLAKISEELYIRTIANIAYDGKYFDADTRTITVNLPGKLKEIEAREMLNMEISPDKLFWRDSNNLIHYWPTQLSYKNWLLGLVIAISDRNTTLYAKAWTKKAEVEALTDINDILNYDVTTGW